LSGQQRQSLNPQSSILIPVSPSTTPVALVTGAAKRIGRTIALALARDGWDVGVHYGTSQDEATQTVREIEALGRRAVALPCDLAVEAEVRQLVATCSAALGPVRCVVNNASLFAEDTIADFAASNLLRHMAINVTAPLLLAQALHAALSDALSAELPDPLHDPLHDALLHAPPAAMPEALRGVVINLLDQKLFNPNPDYLSYTLSKAALHEATTVLAQALAPKVRVVGVAPGITLTSGDQTEAGFGRAHGKTPLGRSSTPDDVAAAVVYLARAQAVTGTTLLVDGGQHLLPSPRDVMFLAS
jgi:NAD(P)-dependent dehydrogenase (short-subunit alcohol dehydrogenase family)